jgi:hypothetical protein
MKVQKLYRILIPLLLGLSLFACRPADPTPMYLPTTEHLDLMKTSEALVTQSAKLTQTAQPSLAETPTATALTFPTTIPTIERSPTPAPSPTTSISDCNRASPGEPFDITIPDDTSMYAGQEFVKTWRLVNTGACKWTRLYKLVFFSQNPMGAHQEYFLPAEVLPGQAIDLSVTFFAPTAPGTYQSNWMLQDANGNLFGIGFNADAPFYVRIQVTNQATPTPTATTEP